jgi:hypothetical protein
VLEPQHQAPGHTVIAQRSACPLECRRLIETVATDRRLGGDIRQGHPAATALTAENEADCRPALGAKPALRINKFATSKAAGWQEQVDEPSAQSEQPLPRTANRNHG